MKDIILPAIAFTFACLAYYEVKKQSAKLLEREVEVKALKRENTQLKLKLIPIEVSRRYEGFPRDVQYDIWYKLLLEEFPDAVNYSETRLTSTFNYYLDFHNIK